MRLRMWCVISVIAASAGCGDDADATAAPVAPSSEPSHESPPLSPAVDGSNLAMASITIDGVKLTDLSCSAPEATLFLVMTVISPVGDRKEQLQACLSEGESVTVRWVQDASAVQEVQAQLGTRERSQCVIDAMQGAPATIAAECGAVMSLASPQPAD